MEDLLETIRTAAASEATLEQRAAAEQACRIVLASLEPQPTEPLPPAAEQQLPIAQLAAAIRTVPLDQLLDLAIAKLRSALPADTPVPTVKPLAIPLVSVRRAT